MRKAKNNLIIKKTTEYVNTVLPGQGTGGGKRSVGEKPDRPVDSNDPVLNAQYAQVKMLVWVTSLEFRLIKSGSYYKGIGACH